MYLHVCISYHGNCFITILSYIIWQSIALWNEERLFIELRVGFNCSFWKMITQNKLSALWDATNQVYWNVKGDAVPILYAEYAQHLEKDLQICMIGLHWSDLFSNRASSARLWNIRNINIKLIQRKAFIKCV